MQRQDARTGMRVVFGRPGANAEKSLGVIEKCNPAKAVVSLLEERGTRRNYPVGTKFTVPYSLMEPEPASGDKQDVQIKGRAGDTTDIIVGETTFRATHADSNPLWLVKAHQGRDTYLCEVVNEPFTVNGKTYDGEWTGTQKAFLGSDIRRAIGMSKLFEGLHNEHERFYAGLKPGQTVHYHNGFEQYVRCTVVVKDGKNVLKPVALVGNWREHDMPRRLSDGTVYLGHHAQQIANGETFTPNASNILEHTHKPRAGSPDPRTLLPIDLSVPDMTPEQAALAAKWRKVGSIRDAVQKFDGDPQGILDTVRDILAS